MHGFGKHLLWFRCGGKGKHLNLASRQNQSVNPLTTNALQDFRQRRPWFRCQQGLERSGMQMCPGGTSEKGIPERTNRIAHASEPEQNPRKSLQHIEKLSIARLQQTHPLVHMRRQRETSEPLSKAESSSQPTHNKRVARLSVTMPVVQMPAGFGTQRNANVPRRCFWRGVPQNVQQNSPGHLNRKETQKITATH